MNLKTICAACAIMCMSSINASGWLNFTLSRSTLAIPDVSQCFTLGDYCVSARDGETLFMTLCYPFEYHRKDELRKYIRRSMLMAIRAFMALEVNPLESIESMEENKKQELFKQCTRVFSDVLSEEGMDEMMTAQIFEKNNADYEVSRRRQSGLVLPTKIKTAKKIWGERRVDKQGKEHLIWGKYCKLSILEHLLSLTRECLVPLNYLERERILPIFHTDLSTLSSVETKYAILISEFDFLLYICFSALSHSGLQPKNQ